MEKLSLNVIYCPNCHKDIGGEQATVYQHDKDGYQWDVGCNLCGHKWIAETINFRKRENPFPNPFTERTYRAKLVK
jgi:hypothetical protein